MAKQHFSIAAVACTAAAFLIIPPATAADPVPCNGKTPTVVATKDADNVQGTPDADVISDGGFKDLTVKGMGGDDTICVSLGANTVEGGAGNDWILGGAANDTIEGGDDNDTIDGAAGDDTITGNEGNDTVDGGVGTNTLTGGLGDDTIKGSGIDRLSEPLKQATGLTIDAAKLTVDGLGHDTFTSIEVFLGSPQTDTFKGSTGPDTFIGWGDDADIVSGFGGDDNLTIKGGGEVRGNAGNDTLTVVNGGKVLGGKGNDLITTDIDPQGKAPVDFNVTGSSGDDRVVVRDGANLTSQPPVAGGAWKGVGTGGSGTDVLMLDYLTSSVQLNLSSGSLAWGTKSSGTVFGFEKIRGSNTADQLFGSGNGERIAGKGGDDLIKGRAGDDKLIGGDGIDSTFGGKGSDKCVGEIEKGCQR